MKRTLVVFLAVIFLFSFSGLVSATERIVQLTIPGCSSWGGTFGRVGSILKKIDGVIKQEHKGNDLLIITFDDKKTSLNIIIDELIKGKFSVNGEPVFLK